MEQPILHGALSSKLGKPGKSGNGITVIADRWQRFELCRIEQLRNAILGVSLDAMQMKGPKLGGRLTYAATNGLIASTGIIEGKVTLRGPLPGDTLILMAFLKAGPATHLALTPVDAGDVALMSPGAVFDAQLGRGTLYCAVALSERRLASEMVREGVAVDRLSLVPAGIRRMALTPGVVSEMAKQLERSIGDWEGNGTSDMIAPPLIRAAVKHLATLPSDAVPFQQDKHAGIVERARTYTESSLASVTSVPAIANAAGTSTRSLYRAYSVILGTTPNDYLRLLRLNRIRQELVSEVRRCRNVSTVARELGISDLGRMAGWYRSLFGEYPSDTLAWCRSMEREKLL